MFSPSRVELSVDTAPTRQDRVEVGGLPLGAGVLVVTRGPSRGARFLLDQPVTSAGRYADSDIFLDDATVSRFHAELRRDGEVFVVVDVGSLNGTFLNRVPVVNTAVLADRDEIQLGKFRLVFLTAPLGGAIDHR
ncbi:FHA domain-containing protein [Antrihabitans sp. YC3-6]|uniref:FHA domain-containing protein n=2 Tax=Antrihabitans stalagmiti TaxID=2799499 RepID=A0A934NT72_9NOCA|nr:FHA domain-containing protein [Antrihabitans stalagmiti]